MSRYYLILFFVFMDSRFVVFANMTDGLIHWMKTQMKGYLVQPVGQAEVHQPGVSDLEPVNVEDDPEGVEEVDDDDELQMLPSSSHLKRKRDEDEEDSEDEDDVVEYTKSSSKKHL
ncbi:hypothetical protein OIU78_028902 [Salix suchowensis]|nr:hypothetical protein OIU78_028902 [Salix suchowensis]